MVFWMRVIIGMVYLAYNMHCTRLHVAALEPLLNCAIFRDMSVEDAIELGQRSIYHATFRDAVSGGTVSGKSQLLTILTLLAAMEHLCPKLSMPC